MRWKLEVEADVTHASAPGRSPARCCPIDQPPSARSAPDGPARSAGAADSSGSKERADRGQTPPNPLVRQFGRRGRRPEGEQGQRPPRSPAAGSASQRPASSRRRNSAPKNPCSRHRLAPAPIYAMAMNAVGCRRDARIRLGHGPRGPAPVIGRARGSISMGPSPSGRSPPRTRRHPRHCAVSQSPCSGVIGPQAAQTRQKDGGMVHLDPECATSWAAT